MQNLNSPQQNLELHLSIFQEVVQQRQDLLHFCSASASLQKNEMRVDKKTWFPFSTVMAWQGGAAWVEPSCFDEALQLYDLYGFSGSNGKQLCDRLSNWIKTAKW